jgi:hypothetical protein
MAGHISRIRQVSKAEAVAILLLVQQVVRGPGMAANCDHVGSGMRAGNTAITRRGMSP